MISTGLMPDILRSIQMRWYGLDIGTKKLSVFMIFAIFCSIFSRLLASVVPRNSVNSASSGLFSIVEKLTPPGLFSLIENSCPMLDRDHSTETPMIRRSYLRSPLAIIDWISLGQYGMNSVLTPRSRSDASILVAYASVLCGPDAYPIRTWNISFFSL